jgi:serine/threonine protein kinase
MATCPVCFIAYPDAQGMCPTHRVSLLPDTAAAAVDRDVAPGTVVGDYRIEGKIGEGGFGAVYRATHTLIGKRLALKVLSRALSSDPEMLSRFIAEARVVNDIQSRHIVDIFGYGALPDGRQYYVMELLSGRTLAEFLGERQTLPLHEALPIFGGIARALDAAHAKGVVHRDLKPENVFLVEDADGSVTPKLLDFGIAKLLVNPSGSHKTRTGMPMGTPHYMSPEQCMGEGVDQRTDIYAFGVLVYEVLTGRLPFDGDSMMAIFVGHTSREAAPPSSYGLGLAPGIDAAILAMLAKRPELRPASCGAAFASLGGTGQRGSRTNPGMFRETVLASGAMAQRPPRSRRPFFLALAAALVVATGAVAWRFAWRPSDGAAAASPSVNPASSAPSDAAVPTSTGSPTVAALPPTPTPPTPTAPSVAVPMPSAPSMPTPNGAPSSRPSPSSLSKGPIESSL